jgi:hypothetical protein
MPRKLVLSGAFVMRKNKGILSYIILMEAINSSMGKLSAPTNPASICEGEVERIWNCTQHTATPEQREQGVVDLSDELRNQLTELLTFEELPTSEELRMRSIAVLGTIMAAGATPGDRVMLGGAPFFMEELTHTARELGLVPVFAFSRRESVERVLPDGTVQKTAIFRHLGFVEPSRPQP